MDTQPWTRQLDELTSKFKEQFGALSQQQLNWKPDAQRWSIAQNLDHLMVINSSYFPILESLRQGTYKAPFSARIGFIVRLLGKTLLAAVQPGAGKKTKTFPIWEPSASELPADILERFARHQQELKQQISSSEAPLQQGAVISSPANRFIVYKLETAFDILIAHERRHLQQALQVRNELPEGTSLAK
ncbi:DinB family protein [Cesiribacter andamanensis]|uniref:DinB superfamily protein n=1 Tax=Cesiribacter andamanensis AMV16 TaxID=1279009 RepID=M7MYR1_9BACT|nr:DinB family protein [Cesiribacter andamanensis]EMR01598.1 DinB superfamily protein [Cesiribacter andamanensis AMV16]